MRREDFLFTEFENVDTKIEQPKENNKLTEKELFEKIQAETTKNIVICPIQGEKTIPQFDYEEIEPLLTFLNKDKLPDSDNLKFPKGTVCTDGRLDLCKQSLGVAGCKLAAKALSKNNSIKSLLLGTNGIGDQGAEEIAELVKENNHLETIYLGCNYIKEEGVAKLADALIDNNNVKGLWLKRNPLGVEGAKHIAKMIMKNTTLRTLDLFGTSLGDEGAIIVIEALIAAKETTGIERVYLGGNSLTPTSAKHLALLVKETKTIKDLFMNVNKLGDEGVVIIADALMYNLTMEDVGLASNGLTNQGLEVLLNSIVGHPSLARLDLGMSPSTKVYAVTPNTFQGDEFTNIVSDFLEKNPNLKHLNFYKLGIKGKDMEKISKSIEKNTHLCEFVGFKQTEQMKKILSMNREELKGKYSSVPSDIANIISVYRTAKKVY